MGILDFFKNNKNKKQSSLTDTQQQVIVPEEKNIDIKITQEENYFKINVADNYKIQEYYSKIQEIDNLGIDKLLNNSVVWNSRKQSVNNGDYFIFHHNGNLYNILINDENIKIDERIPIGEETLNKVFTFYTKDSRYKYFRCMHDKNGSSYNVNYYTSSKIPMLEISKEEFLSDFNKTIQNLETFKNIEKIINLNKFKNIVQQPNYEETLSK